MNVGHFSLIATTQVFSIPRVMSMLNLFAKFLTLTHKRKALKKATNRRTRLALVQPLEHRNLFATLVNASLVTYRDVDGDMVSAQFSAPILTDSNVNNVFAFKSGLVNQSNAASQQLKFINLDSINAPDGLSFSLKVSSRAAVGDGKVNLGGITSTQHAMNDITIDGDLGRVIVGNFAQVAGPTTGMHDLRADSLGRLGVTTGADNLHTIIGGSLHGLYIGEGLTGLTTKGGIYNAEVEIRDSLAVANINGSITGNQVTRSGSINVKNDIGQFEVAGSVIGGAGNQSGRIVAENGGINFISVSKDLKATSGSQSGYIFGKSKLGIVLIGGNIVGGTVPGTGKVATFDGNIAAMTVNGDLIGNATLSGIIQAKSITTLVVHGSLKGGLGNHSAAIITNTSDSIVIDGNVRGGSGAGSGQVQSLSKLGSLVIGGNLLGGGGDDSGTVESDLLSFVQIKKNVVGGLGENTGQIRSNGLVSHVEINGNLQGGDGPGSGSVRSNAPDNGVDPTLTLGADVEYVSVVGNVSGGVGPTSGSVYSRNNQIKEVHIGGSIVGGIGIASGAVNARKSIGEASITKDVIGGAGPLSGIVYSRLGQIHTVNVNGNLTGGDGYSSGIIGTDGAGLAHVNILGNVTGVGEGSGNIIAYDDIFELNIGGSLLGGKSDSGEIIAKHLDHIVIGGSIVGGSASGNETISRSGAIIVGYVGQITVNGDIKSGIATIAAKVSDSGTIRAMDCIDSVLVKGSMLGNAVNPVIIQARMQVPNAGINAAIKSVTVNGNAVYSRIIAGKASRPGDFDNADAQIGAILVGGDWLASSATAGISAGANGMYGDRDDVKFAGTGVTDDPNVRSKISSITIVGKFIGTDANDDIYGIEAQHIVTVSIHGVLVSLKNGPSNDNLKLGPTNPSPIANFDLRLREFA